MLYTDVMVFGGVSTGGCTSWLTSMGGALDVTHLLSQFTSLTMVTYDLSAGTPVTSACTNPRLANTVRAAHTTPSATTIQSRCSHLPLLSSRLAPRSSTGS